MLWWQDFSDLKRFDADEAFQIACNQNRSLELTVDRLWQMGYAF
jgi:hypothetical protein